MLKLLLIALLADNPGSGGNYGVVEQGAGTISSGSFNLLDDINVTWGTGSDASCQYDTIPTPDMMVCGVGADNRVWDFAEAADLNTDWVKTAQTNPTVCVQSADATTVTDRICFSHDQTDADISVDGAAGALNLRGALGTRTITMTKANCAADTVTITRTIGSAASVATVGTDGVDFTCNGAASDAACATNICTWIATLSGMGCTVATNVITTRAQSITMAESAATSDATCAAIVNGSDAAVSVAGAVAFLGPAGTVGSPGFSFAADNDGTGTGLYRISANDVGMSANGVLKAEFWTGGFLFPDAIKQYWGTGAAASNAGLCMYQTAETPDAMVCAMNTLSRVWLFVESGDEGFDFAHAQQTNPTLFVHSANQSTTQWISLTHDGTNGIIGVGTGILSMSNGVTVSGGLRTVNDSPLQLGTTAATSSQFRLEYNTAQTPDTASLSMSTASRSLLLIEAGDEATDFAHAQQTNPTLFVHAADQTDTTKWLSLTHDGTNGILDVGKGVVSIPDGITTAASVISTATTTIGWSVVAGANTACTTTCTNACVMGFDTGLGGSDLVDCADATADRCLCAGAN